MSASGRETTHSQLSTISLASIVAASMIGAGVFTTSGFSLADLKSPWLVMLAWLCAALIALCGAVGYGLLAERITQNGGEYLYLSRFVHPSAGFVAGWVSLSAGFTGAGAFAASTFEAYLLPDALRPDVLPDGSPAVILVMSLTGLHAFKMRIGIVGHNVIVIGKLLLLCGFIAWCFLLQDHWPAENTTVPDSRSSSALILTFATSIMWISLSYSGFNAGIYVAGEARSGSGAVARAMLLGTAIVSVLYLLLNYIFVFAAPMNLVSGREDIAIAVAESLGSSGMTQLVRTVVCLGLATSVSSIIVTGPRVYAKMAEDRLFPSFFAVKTGPPARAIVLQGILICVVTWLVSLQSLLSYLGMTLALSAAATVSTLFLPNPGSAGQSKPVTRSLRIRTPAAACYVLATSCLAVLAGMNRPTEAIAALVTVGSGLLCYFLLKRLRLLGSDNQSISD